MTLRGPLSALREARLKEGASQQPSEHAPVPRLGTRAGSPVSRPFPAVLGSGRSGGQGHSQGEKPTLSKGLTAKEEGSVHAL